jgi:hypothetical protein
MAIARSRRTQDLTIRKCEDESEAGVKANVEVNIRLEPTNTRTDNHPTHCSLV